MGRILVGTAAWTDQSLIQSGAFYPPDVRDAEHMLKFYAEHFPLVEVDSSYHALPSERNSRLWVERTPADFVFDVKAFALMTTHPTEVAQVPKSIREMLSSDVLMKPRIYIHDLPPDAIDLIWLIFNSGIRPLHDAGKLGAVCLQFPKWFHISPENKDYILECKSRLRDYRAAVEFREKSWLAEEHIEETLGFLEEHDIAYTVVDEPQGFSSSVPPVNAVTSDALAIVRMHGRNAETWGKSGIPHSERYKYLYSGEELADWAVRVRDMALRARQVQVIFKNSYQDYAVRNAAQMQELLAS
jgi:uncharacterized protein YecE (DUF72 family)